jgi:DNA processing protein
MTERTQAELLAWLNFLHAPGLGAGKRRAIYDTLGTIEAVVRMHESQARALRVSTETLAALRRPEQNKIDLALRWLEHEAHQLIVLGDSAYPELLARASDAPVALWSIGDLARLRMPSIAVVGSRGATSQGADFAKALASAFSATGLTVVSGLALGIDSAAHLGALVGPGSTAAVLATGLDVIYPKQNTTLAEKISAEGGVIVTEMPLGTAPLPALFPQRNRIISGLSLGVVVVEASLQSGSLVTARFAGEQGREVFAVPGSIHNPMARGCHQLIRQGAKLIESAEDVLSELTPIIRGQLPASTTILRPAKPTRSATSQPKAAPAKPELNPEQAQFLELMGYDPINIDRLVDLSGLSIAALSATLLELELESLVDRLPGARYQRRV